MEDNKQVETPTNDAPVQEIDSIVVDEVKVKLAADNLSSFQKEVKTKLYALKADNETVALFNAFIKNEAKWQHMEALGVEELNKTFADISGVKDGVIYLKNLEVEALHHFLSRVEGSGLESAKNFLKMIRSVNPAIKQVQADNRQYIRLEHELAAAQQGIVPEDAKAIDEVSPEAE